MKSNRKKIFSYLLVGLAIIIVAALAILYKTGKLKVGAETNTRLLAICAKVPAEYSRSLPDSQITLIDAVTQSSSSWPTFYSGTIEEGCTQWIIVEPNKSYNIKGEYLDEAGNEYTGEDFYFVVEELERQRFDLAMIKKGEEGQIPATVGQPSGIAPNLENSAYRDAAGYASTTTDVYFKFDTQSDVWIEIYARNVVSAASPTNKLVQFFTTPAKAQDDSAAKKAKTQAEEFRKNIEAHSAQPTNTNNQQTRTFMDWWNSLSKDQQIQYYQTASPQMRQFLLDNMSTSQKWKIFSKDPRNIVQLVTRSQQTNPLNAILEAAIGGGFISNPWIAIALMPGQETHTVPRTDEEGNTTQVQRVCDTYLLGLVKVNCRDAGTGGTNGGYNPYAYGGGYGGYDGYGGYGGYGGGMACDPYCDYTRAICDSGLPPCNPARVNWNTGGAGGSFYGTGQNLANAATGGIAGSAASNISNAAQKKNLSELNKSDFATETPVFSARVPANSGLLVTGINRGPYLLRIITGDRKTVVDEQLLAIGSKGDIEIYPEQSAQYPRPDVYGITFKPFDENNTPGIYTYLRDANNQERFLAIDNNGYVAEVNYPLKLERLQRDLAHYLQILYGNIATTATAPAAVVEGIGWINSEEEKLLQSSIDEMRRQAGAEGETGLTEDEIIQQLTQQGEPSPTIWGAARPSGEPTQTQGTEVKTSDYIDKCTLDMQSPTTADLWVRFADSIPFQQALYEQAMQSKNEVQLQWALFKSGVNQAVARNTKSGGDEITVDLLGEARQVKSNLQNISLGEPYILYAHPPNTNTKEELICGFQISYSTTPTTSAGRSHRVVVEMQRQPSQEGKQAASGQGDSLIRLSVGLFKVTVTADGIRVGSCLTSKVSTGNQVTNALMETIQNSATIKPDTATKLLLGVCGPQ